MLDPKDQYYRIESKVQWKDKDKNIQFLYFFSDKTHILTNQNKKITQPVLTNLGQFFTLSSGDNNGFLCEWHTPDI